MYKNYKKHFANQNKKQQSLCGKTDVHIVSDLNEIDCKRCLNLLSNKTFTELNMSKKMEKTREDIVKCRYCFDTIDKISDIEPEGTDTGIVYCSGTHSILGRIKRFESNILFNAINEKYSKNVDDLYFKLLCQNFSIWIYKIYSHTESNYVSTEIRIINNVTHYFVLMFEDRNQIELYFQDILKKFDQGEINGLYLHGV